MNELTDSELELLIAAIQLCSARGANRSKLLRRLGTTYQAKKIPADFVVYPPDSIVDGVSFVVYPSETKPCLMRVHVHCPICKREVSVGRASARRKARAALFH